MTAIRPLPSHPGPSTGDRPPSRMLQRARGLARISVQAVDGRSRIAGLHQAGSARIRHPGPARRADRGGAPQHRRRHDRRRPLRDRGVRSGRARQRWSPRRRPSASTAVPRGLARVDARLTVAGDGRLFWLPQETIVFDRSALARSLTADVDQGATLLALEAVRAGRTAMGERLTDIVHDRRLAHPARRAAGLRRHDPA